MIIINIITAKVVDSVNSVTVNSYRISGVNLY